MKKILTILLSFVMIVAVAEERKAGPAKTMEDIQGRCISVTGAVDAAAVDVLVTSLLGAGVSYSNVTYQANLGNAAVASIGNFSGADCVALGFDAGIILSSGTLANAVGPNSSSSTSASLGLPGDADLTTLSGNPTFDATWLQFEFVPTANNVFIQYVFGSEEYNEYVNSNVNDVFAFFVNGQNIALIPGAATPISINTVNNGNWPGLSAGPCMNCEYFRDNMGNAYNIEADAMTTVLTGTAVVTPGVTNTIRIAIADAGDSVWDSWVFVKAESFSTVNPEVPISNWALYLGIFLMITFVVIRFRRMI
ncbi:MAG: choice-of-anchor L domain-containing protein [Bacteroidales bacterium]|nr:choice-of-anchor L domain-containing protein [Bacteroidales bacterium]